MNKYYECRVKYRKTNENGVQKIVTEPYLVDSVNYTEAEARITQIMSEYISEEFRIANIKVTNYAEVHSSLVADIWFKAKVELIAYNEESGKEKKTNMYLLIQADDAKDAYERTVEIMKGTMDYSITAISETNIKEVFPYSSK